jgi:hypothetical protein
MKIFSAQLKGTTIVVEGATASLTGSFTGSVAGIDINATNTFTASTIARLNSIETISSSNDGRVNSLESFTSSTSARLNSIETISASNLNRIGSLETISASNIARISSLETTSASVDTLNTNQNTRLTNLEIKTGSLATTGSNTFIGTQTITGSLYISSDLIVQGSSSLQNITASAVSIGTNLINLNTANPAIRYAGLVIGDSGSVGGSGSFLYDSIQDEMIFVHRGTSTVVTSSVVLMGPQTYDTIGSETYPTNNRIQKGTGNEHLADSSISDDGNIVQIQNTTLAITGSRVGINTSFPTTALDISGSITTNDTFRIVKTPSDTVQQGPSVYLVGGSGASYTQLQQGVDRFIIFGFNGSSWAERLTINNTNGRVGIGTASPSHSLSISTPTDAGSGLQIDKGGSVTSFLGDGGSASPVGILKMYDSGSQTIQLYAGGVSYVTGGNVGIGIKTPLSKLDVSTSATEALCVGNSSGTITSGDLIGALSFVSRDGSTYSSGGVANIRSYATQTYNTGNVAADLRFYVSNGLQNTSADVIFGSEAIRILADGKVGIGTTNASKNLHVYADNGSGILIGRNLTNANNSANLFLYPSNAGSDKRNWGITTYFDRPELLQFRRSSTTTSDPYDSGVTVMTLDGVNDRIGIGTVSPTSILEIATGVPKITITPTNYAGSYRTILGTRSGAEGVLQFGNNSDNFIVGGNSVAGGNLKFYVNATSDFVTGTNGTLAMTIASSANVGIGDGASSIARLNIGGSTKMNRSFYNWYQGSWVGNGTYWHIKTGMWGGGSPSGNIQYTMSLFKGFYYSYSGSILEGAVGFHNWAGTIYALKTTGNLFSNVYTSSDGYVVLVIPSGDGETGVTIDWHQAYGYPFVSAQVTAAKLHGATTGGY